jgi:hypothetical protein
VLLAKSRKALLVKSRRVLFEKSRRTLLGEPHMALPGPLRALEWVRRLSRGRGRR